MSKPKPAKTSFPLAQGRRKGYDLAAVDEFLARARKTYEAGLTETAAQHAAASASVTRTETTADTDSEVQDSEEAVVTAAEVREVSFSLVKRGYSIRHVDAALDRLEDIFDRRERQAKLQRADRAAYDKEIRELAQEVFIRGKRAKKTKFRRRGLFATGYNVSQVDAFVVKALHTLSNNKSLSPVIIREAVFHTQWRGYDEAQVDAYLDALVELVLSEA